MKRQKILHIFNTAGVSNVLNYFINAFSETHNFKSKLITRLYYENFGFSEYYKDKIIKRRDEIFYAYLILIAKKYDILHLNTNDKILPLLRKIFPKKKIVLSYHGTDIRGNVKTKKHLYSHADYVSVSTKELIQDTFNYIPNIVDFHHFNLLDERKIIKNKAIFFHLGKHEIKAEKRINLLLHSYTDLKLTTVKRWEKPIKYKDMPNFLNEFEYFFDVKMVYKDKPNKLNGYLTPYDKSYTANQFLTMHSKKKVIDKNGEITKGFTKEEILKDNLGILNKWVDIYENI